MYQSYHKVLQSLIMGLSILVYCGLTVSTQMHHESHKVSLHIERNRVNDHELIVSQMDRLIPGMTDTRGKLLK